jgi:hypothetical protein
MWSLPLVILIATEKVLLVQGVTEEMKGRAFSTFQVLISSIEIVALNIGAYLWDFFGSLRTVWIVASIIAAFSLIPALIAVRLVNLESETSESSLQ